MLLTIDIGNTNISLGIFKAGKFINSWRLSTTASKTIDEYYITLTGLFNRVELNLQTVKGIIISSVAPKVLAIVKKALARMFSLTPYILGENIEAPIRNLYERPEEVGQDRLVNALSAYHKFRKAVIVVDFGTAITFDIVSYQGEYLGGVIVPGVEISLEALVNKAALIPEVKLDRPKSLLGKNTMESVRSGIIYGFASLCDSLIEKIKEEFGKDMPVVATGGQAELIAPYCQRIDSVNPHLTLLGLKIIFDSVVGPSPSRFCSRGKGMGVKGEKK
jgi:type III pantothenate kinase